MSTAGNSLRHSMDVIKSLFDDEPKPSLHVGEVMCCWDNLAPLAEAVALEQLGIKYNSGWIQWLIRSFFYSPISLEEVHSHSIIVRKESN